MDSEVLLNRKSPKSLNTHMLSALNTTNYEFWGPLLDLGKLGWSLTSGRLRTQPRNLGGTFYLLHPPAISSSINPDYFVEGRTRFMVQTEFYTPRFS